MVKRKVPHAKQQSRAPKNQAGRKELRKLATEYDALNLVERGERLKAIKKNLKCSARALAEALGVDPGTVRRDLRIAELPAKERSGIARGASAVPFLRSKQNRRERPEVDRDRQGKTESPRDSSAVKSAPNSDPQPGSDASILAVQNQIKVLIDSVRESAERISTLEKSEKNTVRDRTLLADLQKKVEALSDKAVGDVANIERNQTSVHDERRAAQQRAQDYDNRRKRLEESCREDLSLRRSMSLP